MTMNDTDRKKAIIKLLENKNSTITGSEIAKIMGVTRQVIIKDIAILRSKGHDIIATPKGYMIQKTNGVRRVFAMKHSQDDIERELTLIVKNSASVINVIVEHPLYGEIIGNLNIETLQDVKRFLAKMETSHAKPLLTLSDGIHLHTLQANSEEILNNLEHELRKANLLL